MEQDPIGYFDLRISRRHPMRFYTLAAPILFISLTAIAGDNKCVSVINNHKICYISVDGKFLPKFPNLSEADCTTYCNKKSGADCTPDVLCRTMWSNSECEVCIKGHDYAASSGLTQRGCNSVCPPFLRDQTETEASPSTTEKVTSGNGNGSL
jgi:hypothetical protein